jgi:pimeloyl-ACP methyl ester carboxylesterase
VNRQITLIGVDRFGYGGSDPLPSQQWASLGAAADELGEVLDRLQAGPVGVAGWSMGGLVALALAARRPDLVDRVAVIGAPAPDQDVAWIPAELKAALQGQSPDQVRELLGKWLAPAVLTDPQHWLELLGAGAADELVLEQPGVRERLTAMLAVAFEPGTAGLTADVASCFLQPWGFQPEQVSAKTLLLYGAKDSIAGPRHGKWYQQRIPNSRYEQVPGAGHLLVVPVWRRVLFHLAPHTKR